MSLEIACTLASAGAAASNSKAITEAISEAASPSAMNITRPRGHITGQLWDDAMNFGNWGRTRLGLDPISYGPKTFPFNEIYQEMGPEAYGYALSQFAELPSEFVTAGIGTAAGVAALGPCAALSAIYNATIAKARKNGAREIENHYAGIIGSKSISSQQTDYRDFLAVDPDILKEYVLNGEAGLGGMHYTLSPR